MAQFDVHHNTGRHADTIPFVVVVQSSLYDGFRRRVVVPLVKKAALGNIANPRFNPVFKIKNQNVVLHPLEIVSIPMSQLGERVGSLLEDGQRIADALDELFTKSWG